MHYLPAGQSVFNHLAGIVLNDYLPDYIWKTPPIFCFRFEKK